MNNQNEDTRYRLSMILSAIFLLLMPAIYNIGNTFISVIWTVLGGINAIYLIVKNRKTDRTD